MLAEHDNVTLNPATLNTITAAKKVGGDVTVLVVGGSGSSAVATAASKVAGVKSVLHAENAAYAHGVAENITNAVLKVQGATRKCLDS